MSEHWIDRAWKDLLKGEMDDAITFFMPSLAADRDYSKAPEVADPIHSAIGGKSDKDSNISDVCFKVPLKNGEFPRTIFLVEQQHNETKEKSLPLRVFQSWYRASDEYQFPVTALVIYTGAAKPINTYFHEWHGTSVNFMFNTYSVPDEADLEELKHDERPFAIAILASKMMIEAKGSPLKRGEYSLELLDLLIRRRFDDEKISIYKQFISDILQIHKEDINKSIKEVWNMQFKTQDEARKEIYLRNLREESLKDIVQKMLARKMSVSDIVDLTGLDEVYIIELEERMFSPDGATTV